MNRSAKNKRRIRDAQRRAAEIDAKHQHELTALREQHRTELLSARTAARTEGYDAGVKSGQEVTRKAVLDHSGSLFMAGRDEAAKAVREIHALLP